MLSGPPLSVVVVVAVVAVVGALFALFSTRLASTLVAVVAVVVGAAGVGLATGGPTLATVLLLGGFGLLLPVVAGVVVVDLDGRPPRTLRPWRLLMLLPVPLIAVALWRPGGLPPAATTTTTSTDAALLALLALAAVGPCVLLLLRRREAQ